MAWIESHQELARHPKTKRLARAAGISIPAAIGHLHLLWWWALDYAQDGDLDGYSAEDIADAAEWSGGDANHFVNALESAGFLDHEEGWRIHDWHDYAGRLLEQREAKAKYKKRQYALYNDLRLTRAVKERDGDTCQYCGKTVVWQDKRSVDGGTYDHVDPAGDNDIDNIVVCCRGCNSKKGGRTPKEARMQFISGGYTLKHRQNTGKDTANKSAITVPNLTQPDSTVPDQTVPDQPDQTVDAPAPAKKKRKKAPAPEKIKFAEFVSMTNDEYTSLVAKLGEIGASRCIEILDNYKGANGKKYDSDYRAILNWVVDRYEEEKAKGGHVRGQNAVAGAGFGRPATPREDWSSFEPSSGFKRADTDG